MGQRRYWVVNLKGDDVDMEALAERLEPHGVQVRRQGDQWSMTSSSFEKVPDHEIWREALRTLRTVPRAGVEVESVTDFTEPRGLARFISTPFQSVSFHLPWTKH